MKTLIGVGLFLFIILMELAKPGDMDSNAVSGSASVKKAEGVISAKMLKVPIASVTN